MKRLGLGAQLGLAFAGVAAFTGLLASCLRGRVVAEHVRELRARAASRARRRVPRGSSRRRVLRQRRVGPARAGRPGSCSASAGGSACRCSTWRDGCSWTARRCRRRRALPGVDQAPGGVLSTAAPSPMPSPSCRDPSTRASTQVGTIRVASQSPGSFLYGVGPPVPHGVHRRSGLGRGPRRRARLGRRPAVLAALHASDRACDTRTRRHFERGAWTRARGCPGTTRSAVLGHTLDEMADARSRPSASSSAA